MKHKLDITIYGKGMEGAPTMTYEEALGAVRDAFLRFGVDTFSFSAFTTVSWERKDPRTSYTAEAHEYGVGSGEMKGIEERLKSMYPDDVIWCEWNEERV